MKKLLSVLLAMCLLATTFCVFTLPAAAEPTGTEPTATGTEPTTAETEVVVWEGDINREFTTSQCIAVVDVDSFNQAIRDDLAKNGPATKYVLTTSDSRYIDGDSGYATWGFYQEEPDYLECWPDKSFNMNTVTWSRTEQLSQMSQNISICIFSDATDTVYVGHVKLVATHEPTTAETEVVVWEGDINQEFTTSHYMAVVDVDSFNQAIRADLAKNGPATKYVLTTSDSRYISGDSDYATWGFYQEEPDYLECWPDKGFNMNTITWSKTEELSKMGQNISICIFSDGTDTVYVGHVKLVATREPASTETETTTKTTAQPTTPPDWQLVYDGAIAEQECDFTVDKTSSINNMTFLLAMQKEIETYGVSEKYQIISDAAFSGSSGFACWGFWDKTNTASQWWGWDLYSAKYPYVITREELLTVNFNENWVLGFVGEGTCTVEATTFQVYAYRPGYESTETTASTESKATTQPTEKREGVTKVYKFTFEDEAATSILKKDGEVVGEVVEWPEGSGNHCLRYEINDETRTGAGGNYPYIAPNGIGDALVVQGDLADTDSKIELRVDLACSGNTLGSYMYPFIQFNNYDENYADMGNCTPGFGQFKTGIFNWSQYEAGAPQSDLDNGAICFCDEKTLPEGSYIYIDNIEFNWVGEWQDVEKLLIGYPSGVPCEESDLEMGRTKVDTTTDPTATGTETETGAEPTETATVTEAEPTETATATEVEPTETAVVTEAEPTATGTQPTATPSIRPTQIRDGVTQVYKFTFEDKNATSILKVGDKVIGEVVEWPEGSGNHCLRYQINSETRDRSGCHPYLWPEGIGESLCAQGDLEESGSKIELKVDVACSGSTQDSYMLACLVFNDLEENYADRRNDTIWPGTNQFNTGVVTWSSYDFSTLTEGRANGGVGFHDDETLPEGAYMYIDNVEFNWIGEWIELDKTFVGYPGGIPCEESDMEIVAPIIPTATGTETETAAPTATAAPKEYHAIDSWSDATGVDYVWLNPNNGAGQIQLYSYHEGDNGTWTEFAGKWANLAADQYIEIVYTGNFAGATEGKVTFSSLVWNETNGSDDCFVSVSDDEIVVRLNGPLTSKMADPNLGLAFADGTLSAISDALDTHVTVTVYEEGAEPTTTATEAEPTATATATATETGAQPTETVTEAEPTETEIQPTETEVQPTETEIQPTETEVQPTETEVQPTETEVQPTETEVQPTETEIQPTETEIQPTDKPTAKPTESKETTEPTDEPTAKPTESKETTEPTAEPTAKPTAEPTEPVIEPTDEPTVAPTEEPTSEETVAPTDAPTDAPKDVIYGDANGDGTVNMKDVLMIRKYIADLPVDITLDAADANGDGVVNMKDVLIVRKFIAGLIDTLGA